MVKRVIDTTHDGERLIYKVLRLRYPYSPQCDKPVASYNVISKYLKVSHEKVRYVVRQFKKVIQRGENYIDDNRKYNAMIKKVINPKRLQYQAYLTLKERVSDYNDRKEEDE